MTDHAKVLAFIAKCGDPTELRGIINNAADQGVEEVRLAAFKRLIEVVPEEKPGSVEHDFWRSITAFEHLRTVANGKTTRLSRTRQKVKRVGILKVLEDFALGRETEGYESLMELEMPELTGEAIILRHQAAFTAEAVAAARSRLSSAGVDLGRVLVR